MANWICYCFGFIQRCQEQTVQAGELAHREIILPPSPMTGVWFTGPTGRGGELTPVSGSLISAWASRHVHPYLKNTHNQQTKNNQYNKNNNRKRPHSGEKALFTRWCYRNCVTICNGKKQTTSHCIQRSIQYPFFLKKNTRPKVRQVLQDKGKRDASPHCTGQGLSLDKTQNT